MRVLLSYYDAGRTFSYLLAMGRRAWVRISDIAKGAKIENDILHLLNS